MKGIDYANGKIYKLVCDETNDVYYGSTCGPLAKRIYGHKNDLKNYNNGNRRYVSSFPIVKYESVQIILVETYPCTNKDELNSRERFYIENNPCINKRVPNRTLKEYRRDNKEKIEEQGKIYRENNYEKEKERHRIYKENNPEKVKESKRKYKEANKEKLNQKIECECGSVTCYASKSRHLKSKKHQSFLNQ